MQSTQDCAEDAQVLCDCWALAADTLCTGTVRELSLAHRSIRVKAVSLLSSLRQHRQCANPFRKVLLPERPSPPAGPAQPCPSSAPPSTETLKTPTPVRTDPWTGDTQHLKSRCPLTLLGGERRHLERTNSVCLSVFFSKVKTHSGLADTV